MTDIFLSYSRADRSRVEKLAAALEASGFSIWWDRKIDGGSEFAKETETRLNEAAVVLVCWSAASIDSMWVADEATVGREKGVLVPIAIDPVAPKIGFRQIQTIDFSNWNGTSTAAEYEELAHALRMKLEGKASVRPAPAPAAGLAASNRVKPARAKRMAVAVLAVLALAGLAFAIATRKSGAPIGEKSIAVLPFESLSPTSADFDNGDWLAEVVGSLLGKAGDLKVISQSSASAFEGERASVAEIARKLGVALVVVGSVRSEGDDLVVSARLIDAASDRQIWSEIYERKSGNALSVQSEVAAKVAAAVAAAMGARIPDGETRALAAPSAPAAFEKYQQALLLYRTTTEKGVRGAQTLLGEAIGLEADFALAWALMSRVHSYLYFNSSDATESRRAAAEAALAEAQRLEPDLAEVMLADAYYEYWVKRDFPGARSRFEKLRARWPNNADVLTALASIARRQGRWDESKVYFESAVAIDPMRPGRRLKAAEANFATRDFDGALRQLDASLVLWPEAPDSLPFIAKKALVFQAQGRLDDAGALIDGFDPQPDGNLVQPIVYQAMLRRRYGEAIALVEELAKRDKAEGSPGRTSIDLNLYLGDLRRLALDATGAEGNYRQALDELLAALAAQPDNADIHSYLALAYCGLGDRDSALRYAALAVKTVPMSSDALSGAYYLDVEARVLARLGERDKAIETIARLMRSPAYLPLTPALLRLDPDFDALRSDPRFASLIKE